MWQGAQDNLPVFLILWNLRKSSEVFGCLRKSSENFRKLSQSPSSIFQFFWNLWKSSEKMSGKWKFSKIFGNLRKCSEMLGKLRNPRKFFECNRRFMKMFLYYSNLWHLWTEDQIQEFWFVICTGITLFALVLLFNRTALSQSESSKFFMYVISRQTNYFHSFVQYISKTKFFAFTQASDMLLACSSVSLFL